MKALVIKHDATPAYQWIHLYDNSATYQCKSPSAALNAPLYDITTSTYRESILTSQNNHTFYYYEHDPYLELPELFI